VINREDVSPIPTNERLNMDNEFRPYDAHECTLAKLPRVIDVIFKDNGRKDGVFANTLAWRKGSTHVAQWRPAQNHFLCQRCDALVKIDELCKCQFPPKRTTEEIKKVITKEFMATSQEDRDNMRATYQSGRNLVRQNGTAELLSAHTDTPLSNMLRGWGVDLEKTEVALHLEQTNKQPLEEKIRDLEAQLAFVRSSPHITRSESEAFRAVAAALDNIVPGWEQHESATYGGAAVAAINELAKVRMGAPAQMLPTPAAMYPEPHVVTKPPRKHNHYYRPFPFDSIDPYRLGVVYDIKDPNVFHALKKLMVLGGRGAKDAAHDVQDVIDTMERWKEMREEEAKVVQ
jgi:hypothetical protein